MPSLASLLYKKKTSGREIRRTPDVKLRFVGFNFGQVQLFRFVVVVMIRSNLFGHLNSVMLITLLSNLMIVLIEMPISEILLEKRPYSLKTPPWRYVFCPSVGFPKVHSLKVLGLATL